MAMSVLSIGATGVVAMQKVTLLGNTRARDLATASAIASAWIERLRYDGLRWTFDDANGVTTLAATEYLDQTQGAWFRPANGTAGVMTGTTTVTDVKGMDTTVALENAFCVNIRLQTLMSTPAPQCDANQVCPSAIRAEVRVYWLKVHNTQTAALGGTVAAAPFCDGTEIATIDSIANGTRRYHFVYMTSAILRNDT